MNKDTQAITSADNLLDVLIKSQPDLIRPVHPSPESGKDVGEFIAGLRQRLIAMYEQTPR